MDFCRVNEIIIATKDFLLNRDEISIVEKGVDNFVTNVDKNVENFLKENLSKLFPNSTFVCEESNPEFSDSYFVIDPLDGTTNFIKNLKCSAVSVAYVENGEIKYAALFNPFTDEFLYDIENQVFLNGKPLKKSVSNTSLKDCLVDIGTSPYDKSDSKNMFMMMNDVFKESIDLRRSGSTAVNLMNLVLGRLDVFLENNLSIRDYLAGKKMLDDMGYFCSNFKGKSINNTDLKSSFLCSRSKTAYDETIRILNKYYE